MSAIGRHLHHRSRHSDLASIGVAATDVTEQLSEGPTSGGVEVGRNVDLGDRVGGVPAQLKIRVLPDHVIGLLLCHGFTMQEWGSRVRLSGYTRLSTAHPHAQ